MYIVKLQWQCDLNVAIIHVQTVEHLLYTRHVKTIAMYMCIDLITITHTYLVQHMLDCLDRCHLLEMLDSLGNLDNLDNSHSNCYSLGNLRQEGISQ